MKCPFRTIKKVRFLSYVTKVNETDYDETVEFAECLELECPYWGKKVKRLSDATSRWETVISPVCRRCEEDENKNARMV